MLELSANWFLKDYSVTFQSIQVIHIINIEQFYYDIINSGNVGTVSGLRNVSALSNAINCNVQPLYPEILTFQWKENTCTKDLDHIPPVIK